MPKLLVLFLTVILLAGCRIELSTTTGGSIQTDSGSFSCVHDGACPPIDVVDLFFDETFRATPDPGFVFEGWRRRNRGLCGGSREECRLFTAGFAGNEALLAFLNQPDEVFFLEAVFSEASAGGTGVGNASSCWNEASFTPGTSSLARYDIDDGAGGSVDHEIEGFVLGDSTFNGTNALPVSQRVTTFFSPPTVAETISYYQLGDARFSILGGETEMTSPAMSSERAVYEPSRLVRFDLGAGESFSQSYAVNSERTVSGETTIRQDLVDETTTFNGVETVRVNDRTFEACRFTSVSATNDNDAVTVVAWYHVGSGILLKTETDVPRAGFFELTFASINGAEI